VRSKDKTCSKEDCEIKRQNMFKGRLWDQKTKHVQRKIVRSKDKTSKEET
jgi:hypothetical protein